MVRPITVTILAGVFLFVCTAPDTIVGPERFEFLFVGDTSFCEGYQERLARQGGTNILEAEGYEYSFEKLAPLLAQADLVIANLETPLTDLHASPLAGKKQYIHAGDVVRTPAVLGKHNVNAVSLSNNHTLDYGVEGLRQSLQVLRQHGMQPFGAGPSESEASRPFRVDLKLGGNDFRILVASGFEHRDSYEEKFAFYADGEQGGVNHWTPGEAAEQIGRLRRLEPRATIVAFPHWGENYAWKTEKQTELARAMIDAGADLVLGHGAHQVQEIERYRGRWVVYGLGNLVFNSPGRYAETDAVPFSFAAQITVTEKNGTAALSLKLYPIFSDNRLTNYRPRLVTEDEFRDVGELLVRYSPQPALLLDKLSPGHDETGRFFALDVTPR